MYWNDLTYMQWTSVFCTGSYAKSDWKQGSSIHFLSSVGKGMYSKIETLEINKKMVFKHVGELDNYKEQPNDEKSSSWSSCEEAYLLTEENQKTTLVVTVDAVEEFGDYFKEVFPKALSIIKEIPERNCITIATTMMHQVKKFGPIEMNQNTSHNGV